jgi:aminoglycoside 6'-N-acetyltransferase I
MTIRPLVLADLPAWKRMRVQLWPNLTPADNDADYANMLSPARRCSVFVAESDEGRLSGFVEVSLRDTADGCDSSPVGYVEGWFVEQAFRGKGIGRALVASAEAWARSFGCTEMASDALIDNIDSQRAHARLGYAEVDRMVSFRKSLI